jgi:integrase
VSLRDDPASPRDREAGRAEGAARTTIKKELNTLSVALKHAGNRGWVPHSAAIECVPPFAAQSEPRTRWLTLDEFPKLLAALDTTEWMAKRASGLGPDEAERQLREHGEHVADRQLFVTVACFTGAELSALSRLDWTDVDFVAGRIRIPGTKNATRDQTIDLDPQLAAALRRVPFGRRIGPVLRPWANACTDLRAACKRAGIERVTPHTFRHVRLVARSGRGRHLRGRQADGPQGQQDGRALLRSPCAKEQERGDGPAAPVPGALSVGDRRGRGWGTACHGCAKPGGDSWRKWRSWRDRACEPPDEKSGRFRGDAAAFSGFGE